MLFYCALCTPFPLAPRSKASHPPHYSGIARKIRRHYFHSPECGTFPNCSLDSNCWLRPQAHSYKSFDSPTLCSRRRLCIAHSDNRREHRVGESKLLYEWAWGRSQQLLSSEQLGNVPHSGEWK